MLKNKDIDREILLKLKDDKEIIELCHSNRYFFFNVCDNNFFHRRLQQAYPDTLTLNLKREKESWKRFYMRMMYYIFQMKEKYQYDYHEGNPVVSLDILEKSKNNMRLLFNAAENGEIGLIKEALSRGVDIQIRGNDALDAAVSHSQLGAVKFLVEHGANLHDREDLFIRLAAIWGNLDVVKYLVSKGANIHVRNDEAIKSALNYGHKEIYKFLKSLP